MESGSLSVMELWGTHNLGHGYYNIISFTHPPTCEMFLRTSGQKPVAKMSRWRSASQVSASPFTPRCVFITRLSSLFGLHIYFTAPSQYTVLVSLTCSLLAFVHLVCKLLWVKSVYLVIDYSRHANPQEADAHNDRCGAGLVLSTNAPFTYTETKQGENMKC